MLKSKISESGLHILGPLKSGIQHSWEVTPPPDEVTRRLTVGEDHVFCFGLNEHLKWMRIPFYRLHTCISIILMDHTGRNGCALWVQRRAGIAVNA